MPRIRLPYAALLLVLAVACDAMNPVDPCACSFAPPHTMVYGRVADPAGEGVAGAAVGLVVGPPGCASVVGRSDGQADAAGRYRLPAWATQPDSSTTFCVRVWALAPVGSGLRDSDTVRFNAPVPRRFPNDSIRVDLALRVPASQSP